MRLLYFFILLSLLPACSGQTTSNDNDDVFSSTGREVVCLVYHRFGDSRFPSTNISLSDFEDHLRFLASNNFEVVTLSEAINYVKSGEPTRKTAVLTIDDGYKSFFKNALPLLKKYHMPATLFINTETVGGGDYMNWTELKAVSKAGIEIGNHTHSHAYFLNESKATRYATFEKEIVQSQDIISKNLETTPVVFAYPYGEFDQRMKDIVRDAGFKGAAAQNSGVLYAGTDLYQIPRFPMSEAYAALEKFKEKIMMRPLEISKEIPDNTTLPDDLQPELTLTFYNTELELNRLQCFVQGGTCSFRIISQENRQTVIAVKADNKLISRRRTLYTVTIPDKEERWHWYSHLWINTQVK